MEKTVMFMHLSKASCTSAVMWRGNPAGTEGLQREVKHSGSPWLQKACAPYISDLIAAFEVAEE